MDREDRIERAKELLNDIQEKQAACNKVVGLSFKDIDRVLKAVITEKASKRSEDDDERSENPAKWGDSLDSPEPEYRRDDRRNAYPKGEVGLPYTRDEVAWFLAQKDIILSEDAPKSLIPHKTYGEYEVDALIKGNCHPSIFKRKAK